MKKVEYFDHIGTLLQVEELPDPPQQPLDHIGVAMTLLAVTEVLTVQDAANAVNLKPEDLIAEAEAWAVAQSMSK